MKNFSKVEEFIRTLFELYGLDYGSYFKEFDEDGCSFEPSVIGDDAIDIPILNRAAEILGENAATLLTADRKKTKMWDKQFSFVDLKREFECAYERSFYGKGYDSLRLMEGIFDTEIPNKPLRYDYSDVKKRMFALLREYDKVLPGTYHKGASAQHLHIYTTGFFHFEKTELLLTSFFGLVRRAEELFFRAFDTELAPDEINEYNIIVSLLGIRDRYIYNKGELHYSLLRKLIPVYQAESESEFFDYVMLDSKKSLMPWRCAEFAQNRDIVQAYANIFPDTKRSMREYALNVSKFHCSFAWSDAEPLEYDPDEECADAEIDRMLMLKFIRRRDKYGGLEPTAIYVPKTPDELGDDGVFADLLKELSGPKEKGGIASPTKMRGKPLDIPKMAARVSAIGGGSFG